MKWRKRLYYYVIYLVTITIVLCVIGLYLYHGTPSWYRPPPASDQEIKDAANSADQKLLDLFSWAASAQAQQVRDSKGISTPDEVPVGPKTVTLSDDEVNALFASWNGPESGDWDERMSRYFTGGRVFFTSGGIILAGQSPSLGALVSTSSPPRLTISRISTCRSPRFVPACFRFLNRPPLPISSGWRSSFRTSFRMNCPT